MAKKIYHLTISYDEKEDTIDYICETLDEEVHTIDDFYDDDYDPIEGLNPNIAGLRIVKIDVGKYFDEPTLKLIRECNMIGEA
tara:strand:- start:1436 stop:1684 length:249 start_codon:yes stop_codon:yes gene_type:complete